MDPASVLGVIGVVGQVIKSIYIYGDAVAGQRQEIAHLRSHLYGIQAALSHISEDLTRAAQDGSQSALFPTLASEEAGKVLEETRSILDKLENILVEDSSRSLRLTKKLLWPLKRSEVESLSTNLERVKSYFILATTNDVLHVAHDIRNSLQSLYKSMQELQLPEAYNNASKWLAPCDTEAAFASALSARLPATNSWFFKEHFNQWTSGDYPVLWLKGAPGSGKTCLTSFCAHKLQQKKHIMAYFFCSHNNAASQDPLNVIGSLIVQLSRQQPACQTYFLNAYKEATSSSKPPKIDSLRLIDMMLEMVALLTTEVYLIVDAVDECRDASQKAIKMLFQILTGNKRIRLMLSSRESIAQSIETTIQQYDLAVKRVGMDCEEVRDDVNGYITTRVTEDDKLGRLRDELQHFIMEQLQANHQGSFRWARCTIDDLIRRKTPNEIRSALAGVTPTLQGIYRDILQRVPSDMQQTIAYALEFLVSAQRQLRLPELAEAVSFALAENFDAEDRLIDQEIIVVSLYSLVRYDSADELVQLAHSSVRDFLTSAQASGEHYVDQEKANAAMSLVSLRYLQMPALQQTCPGGELDARKKAWPFFKYASSFWTRHVRASGEMESELLDAITMFAASADGPHGGNFAAWYQCIYPSGDPHVWLTKPLYMCAREGLTGILKILVKTCDKNQLEQRGGARGSTALHVAATNGEKDCVEALLKAGADPQEQNDFGERGIQWAAFYKHKETVDLLLQSGVSPDLFSRSRQPDIYKQLLQQYYKSTKKNYFRNNLVRKDSDGERGDDGGLWTE